MPHTVMQRTTAAEVRAPANLRAIAYDAPKKPRKDRKSRIRGASRFTPKSMNESAFQYARPPVYTSEKSRCGSCPPKTRSAVSPSVPSSWGIQPRSRKSAAYTTAAPSRISTTRSGRRGPFNAKSPSAGSLDG